MTTAADQVQLSVIEENGVELVVLDSPAAQIAVGPTLSSATPQPLGAAAAGTGSAASRADHVHAHGNQGGGSLHDVATSGTAGFMSSAQFSLLDAATNASTANALVRRDANGDFAANVITGSSFVGPLTGNAATATRLATARTINGVNFDGTGNITITASLANAVTFNNSGSGAASGTTFNGTTARTISYNTVGAPSVAGVNATGTWGISISGVAATATALATARAINGVNFNGTAPITITANTPNALTFSDAGSGGSSGTTFNGSEGRTISFNSVGAPSINGTNATGTWGISISGVAATATALATGRTIALTGDVTGTSAAFDGTGNLSLAATLANSGVSAGTYRSVSVDEKGRVTGGTNPTTLAGYGITDAVSSSDGRLTDQRVPTDASVTDAKVPVGAGIAGAKISPNFGGQDISLSGGDRSITNTAGNALAFGTSNTERVRIAADGRMVKGATSSIAGVNIANGALAAGWQVHATSQGEASLSAMNWSNLSTGSYFNAGKSRGTSIGTHGLVLDGDQIGYYNWIASDGVQFRSAAYMGALVDGTAVEGSTPGRIVFGTTAVGAATPSARMWITSGGTVRVNAVLSTGLATTENIVPTNSNTSTTATATSLLNGIRTGTPTASIDLQLPSGTNMDAAFADLQTNQGFAWSVVNLASATHSITVTANDGHTVVGNMVVAAATSVRFLTRKTAANTFVTYRIS
jgi:hypothetical protein